MKLANMESVKIVYLPAKIISVDHHALNHSTKEIFTEENKAIIRKLAIRKEQEQIAPFYDELHFGNYE